MKNCKDPNNGGNVIRHEDGKIILLDQCGTNVSHIQDWAHDIEKVEGDIEKSEAKAAKTYATSLALDGNELSLLDGQETPHVLDSVVLPAGGGSVSKFAHTKAIVKPSISDAEVVQVYVADGIIITMQNSATSNYIDFSVELTDASKLVFDPNKDILYQFEFENSSTHTFAQAENYIAACGKTATPTDATTPIAVSRTLSINAYTPGTRVIVDVWAELVEAAE